jgi:hypothetical protein
MFDVDTVKKLVWDADQNKMVTRTEVFVRIVGNLGTVFAEEGPLLCETGHDIFLAVEELKGRIFKNLSGIKSV